MKKLILAAAIALGIAGAAITVPVAPASAQGISVHIGTGHARPYRAHRTYRRPYRAPRHAYRARAHQVCFYRARHRVCEWRR